MNISQKAIFGAKVGKEIEIEKCPAAHHPCCSRYGIYSRYSFCSYYSCYSHGVHGVHGVHSVHGVHGVQVFTVFTFQKRERVNT